MKKIKTFDRKKDKNNIDDDDENNNDNNNENSKNFMWIVIWTVQNIR